MKPFEPYYDPDDMTACVEAETTVSQINELAGADGMLFPLYLHPDMPIGQLVETCDWAPRSFRYGSLADNVLGLNFELPGGRVVKIGGRVVKNVTGFDFTRFLCRSGTRFGRVREVVLRLRPRDETEQFRTATGDRAALEAFARAFVRNRWSPVIDLFDYVVTGESGALHLAFGCGEQRVELLDHFLSRATDETGLSYAAGEYCVPPAGPYAAVKTTLTRCMPAMHELVDAFGGTAHAFVGSAFFHFQPSDSSRDSAELIAALDRLHAACAELGGHVECPALTYPDDTIDAGWEAAFREKLALVP